MINWKKPRGDMYVAPSQERELKCERWLAHHLAHLVAPSQERELISPSRVRMLPRNECRSFTGA